MVFKIAILGDIYTDIQTGPIHKLPVWNGDLKAENIDVLLGGSATNTARYISRFGVKTRLFSALGTDLLSFMQLKNLTDEDRVEIDNSLIQIKGTSSPTAIVIYGPMDRTFISNNGSLDKFTADKIDKKLLFGYDHLHIGGYFVCLALHSLEFLDLLKEAKENGMTISMDCQFDSTLQWTGKKNHLRSVLPLLDVFMPSEYEATGITKAGNVQQAIGILAEMMPQGVVLIKNGENGIFFKLPGCPEIHNSPAFKTECIKDTTGAGDSFNAGFLSKWGGTDRREMFGKENVLNATRFGCATATFCIKQVGAFVEGVTNEEVDIFIRAHEKRALEQ